MSNGTVISRVGTAAVALMSETAGRPVLICCETYKFAERVQLDSITANELGNPEALLSGPPARLKASPLAAWSDLPHLGGWVGYVMKAGTQAACAYSCAGCSVILEDSQTGIGAEFSGKGLPRCVLKPLNVAHDLCVESASMTSSSSSWACKCNCKQQ